MASPWHHPPMDPHPGEGANKKAFSVALLRTSGIEPESRCLEKTLGLLSAHFGWVWGHRASFKDIGSTPGFIQVLCCHKQIPAICTLCVETRQAPVLRKCNICIVPAAEICPVAAADICPASTPDICPVLTEGNHPISTQRPVAIVDICPAPSADICLCQQQPPVLFQQKAFVPAQGLHCVCGIVPPSPGA